MRSCGRFEIANTGRPSSKWIVFSAGPRRNRTRPVKRDCSSRPSSEATSTSVRSPRDGGSLVSGLRRPVSSPSSATIGSGGVGSSRLSGFVSAKVSTLPIAS